MLLLQYVMAFALFSCSLVVFHVSEFLFCSFQEGFPISHNANARMFILLITFLPCFTLLLFLSIILVTVSKINVLSSALRISLLVQYSLLCFYVHCQHCIFFSMPNPIPFVMSEFSNIFWEGFHKCSFLSKPLWSSIIIRYFTFSRNIAKLYFWYQ